MKRFHQLEPRKNKSGFFALQMQKLRSFSSSSVVVVAVE